MELVKKITDADIVSMLFTATVQIHIFHLQDKSYASHMALGGLYEGIPDMIDSLVETIQGKTLRLVTNYRLGSVTNFKSVDDIISYNKKMINALEMYRTSLPTSWDNIDNQIQVIIDLFESTNYKLYFLK